MDNELLNRINTLAKKQKEQGLTEQEIQERDNLRKEYLKLNKQYANEQTAWDE